MKNPYVFNEVAHDDCTKIGVNLGTYTFTGITSDHPFGIVISDENKLEVVSGTFLKEDDCDPIKYYTGTVVVNVKADFGTTSYKCSKHGYMGGQDRLVFDSECDTKASVAWIEMRGCCREHVSGVPKRKRYLSHHDNLISETESTGGTMATAVASCKADCAANDLCTAFELHKTKKVRDKKKSKKKSKGYKCELHKATINSSTRKSKSCKKAKCFTKETSVPEGAARV